MFTLKSFLLLLRNLKCFYWQIVRALESLSAEDLTNGMRLGESEVFDSAQQSAEIRLFRRMAFGSQNYSTDFFTHTSYNSRDQNV